MQNNIYISFAIALLYVYFIHKLVDVLMNKQSVDDMCGGTLFGYRRNIDKNHDQCLDMKKMKTKQIETYKFYLLMIIGVLSLIFGTTLITKHIILSNSMLLGGLFMIMSALYNNWYNIDDNMRLILSGISLTILIYFSIRYIK